jgi:tRNA/tmRNA/rRNA uracil-C5-methylase (TrmA/RlmC/RlmD family)
VEFSPTIDRRLIVAVARTGDLDSSADVWRRLRRRAARLRVATPCYESVRRLVLVERERRAQLAATIATVVEIMTKRIPTLPEAVPPIHARHLARYRGRLRLRPP